jgi:hypothetical protein
LHSSKSTLDQVLAKSEFVFSSQEKWRLKNTKPKLVRGRAERGPKARFTKNDWDAVPKKKLKKKEATKFQLIEADDLFMEPHDFKKQRGHSPEKAGMHMEWLEDSHGKKKYGCWVGTGEPTRRRRIKENSIEETEDLENAEDEIIDGQYARRRDMELETMKQDHGPAARCAAR